MLHFIISRVQIQTILRYHFSLTRLAKLQKLDNAVFGCSCRETGTLLIAVQNEKRYHPYKGKLALSNKLHMNSLVTRHPISRNLSWRYIFISKKIHMCSYSFASLLVSVKHWKLPKCLSIGDVGDNFCTTHSGVLCSCKKR